MLCALVGACGDDDRREPSDTGPRLDASGDTERDLDTGPDTNVDRDGGPPLDPFDPANGCGATAIETEQIPGSVLIAFDASGSMQADTNGDRPPSGPSKWNLATSAITSVLASMPDELNVGLLLFPTPGGGDECNVAPVPQVAVGPLGTTRAAIGAEFMRTPDGGQTPAIDATRAAWEYMLPLAFPGERGVILVTDGAENCDTDASDLMSFHNEARTNDLAYGVSTYAVGLTTTNNLLSGLAYNGGTPRTETCMPMCTREGESCMTSADCGGGTCNEFPFLGRVCFGSPSGECCHYDISRGAFRDEFEMALREIAERFLDSCVFDLPRGADPSMFDPTRVNVGVTFAGEERRVLSRTDDGSVDSWNYTTPDNTSIIIQGPICEDLLSGDATVEIVLGCPTILI